MLVACVLVRHFPWACQRHPALAARPGVIVGGPDLISLEADPVHDEERFEAMLDALEAVSPTIELAGLGCAYAEVAGMLGLYKGLPALARALLAAAAPYPTSVGIARGRFAAYVAAASCKPGASAVLDSEQTASALRRAPIEWLPVSREARRRLGLLGLRSVRELLRFSQAQLIAQFGREGQRLWELANGVDEAPLRARARRPSIVHAMELEEPATSLPMIELVARQLLARALRDRRMHGRAAGQVRLRLRLERAPAWERVITLQEPSAQTDHLTRVLRTALEGVQLSGPVAALELALLRLAPESGRQEHLWPSHKARQQARLEQAARQLKARYGYSPLGVIVEVEPWSPFPERRYALADFSS